MNMTRLADVMGQPSFKATMPNGMRSFKKADFLEAVQTFEFTIWFVLYCAPEEGDGALKVIFTRYPKMMEEGVRANFPRIKNIRDRHIVKWHDAAFWALK